ncbi:MAG: universal stress protein [Deltaproteobacteria bacterium]|nr:universal stress protein [Deltaproteobacteria bacterium]
MKDIKKILFPTDFSEGSDEVFSYVLALAKKFNASIDILHVIHEFADITGFYVPHISYDVLEKEMEEAAFKNMKRFCDKNIDSGINYTIHTKKGAPFVEIIKTAREKMSDIIIMGTHGRTGIDHVLFGSTAEKVVRKSPVAVLTVRCGGKAFVMP